MNQEQYTLREIIQQRFEELDAHISALDNRTSKTSIPSFLDTYTNLRLKYEREAFAEGMKEMEDRIVILENYQTVQRFVVRQIVTIGCTALLITIGYVISWYMR